MTEYWASLDLTLDASSSASFFFFNSSSTLSGVRAFTVPHPAFFLLIVDGCEDSQAVSKSSIDGGGGGTSSGGGGGAVTSGGGGGGNDILLLNFKEAELPAYLH